MGSAPLITSYATLHMYFMGFISQLIFAMAVRMLPGFLHKRRVARPGLVEATFWLANASAVGRVALFLLPAGWLSLLPGLRLGVRLAFALSGLFGLAAVLVLAINLWLTQRLESA
jgi:heme/copper-type cytochrome/quinol oxidase subunit 1